MSLARRIIPVLLMKNGALVKGKRFKSDRIVGHVQQAAEIYQARGVDELLVLDVEATLRGRGPDYMAIRALTEKCFMPIAAGGGVRNTDDFRDLISNGADKVVIGTAAYEDPSIITRLSNKFGAQAVVVAIDVMYDGFSWSVATRCGTKQHFYGAVQFAEDMERRGAGELIVTAIRNDGMMNGYDLGLIKRVAEAVSIPVVAAGGCGSYEHMHRALKVGASAVAAGALFQFTDSTPREAAEYLNEKGWEVRL